MEEHENLYEKIQEILRGHPGNLKVMEEEIDMDLQVEYFDCSQKMREEADEAWAMEHVRYLDEEGYSNAVKKDILARLASIERPECYRIIETFAGLADGVLRKWALLALNESRMHLESGLLEENQVFISTGLGGKAQKLRYFVVLISKKRKALTRSQQMVIRNEFELISRSREIEIETFSFSDYLGTIQLLIPLHLSLKHLFNKAIDACNGYGNFLEEDFIVTNVRTLSFPEIKDFLEQRIGRQSDNRGNPGND